MPSFLPSGHTAAERPAPGRPSRRALLSTAAWTTPVFAAALATPLAAASTALSTIEGNFTPFDTELAVGQSTEAVIAFIETSGVDYTGTVLIRISPSRETDTVIATLSAFGPITTDPETTGQWSYAQEGTKLRVTYSGYMEGSVGIRGYLQSDTNSGITVDTGGQYLLTETSHTIEVESAKAVADNVQTTWTMTYGTDGIGAP